MQYNPWWYLVTYIVYYRQCEEGKTAYEVFELKHFFDLESEVDYKTRLDMRNALASLKVNLTQVRLLNPGTEGQLKLFLRAANIDMLPYRRQVSCSKDWLVLLYKQ